MFSLWRHSSCPRMLAWGLRLMRGLCIEADLGGLHHFCRVPVLAICIHELQAQSCAPASVLKERTNQAEVWEALFAHY